MKYKYELKECGDSDQRSFKGTALNETDLINKITPLFIHDSTTFDKEEKREEIFGERSFWSRDGVYIDNHHCEYTLIIKEVKDE